MTSTRVDQIADNLLSIYPLLFKSISRPLKKQSSITPAGMFVLGFLKRCGTQSMSDIGKYLSMPKPHTTVIVDKLIDEGYVVREQDLNDRRIVKISLTSKGLEDFETIRRGLGEHLKGSLMELSEEEQLRLSVASLEVRELLIAVLSEG